MNKHSLKPTGLSLSQAQSISNSCNQHALQLEATIAKVNNCSKKIKVGEDTHYLQKGYAMPENILEIIEELGALRATQAFLMENIKAKDALIKSYQLEIYRTTAEAPKRAPLEPSKLLSQVGEDWGWEQLSEEEINEYYDAESRAAAIGVFIHKRGKLDVLRTELSKIPDIEWMEVTVGVNTPITIDIHHTSEELLNIYDALVEKHRVLEQKVNYFKAKVKNLVTLENSRIAALNVAENQRVIEINRKINEEYIGAIREFAAEEAKKSDEFEVVRQEKIKSVASLRISVPERFQPIIDKFLIKE